MAIQMPSDVTTLEPLTTALDAADHPTRLGWVHSLNGAEQLVLFALAEGSSVQVDDLVRDERQVVIHHGRNGLAMFNLFQKRLSRLGGAGIGYNHNDFPRGLKTIARWVSGPGHFVAYDSPDRPGEVWIDYRRIPEQQHPEFPPLIDNEHGLRALVFGNMVDVLRRVSTHVFIGDSYKNLPRPDEVPVMARIGSLFPTAPFVLCQE